MLTDGTRKAYHEAGHLVLAHVLLGHRPIHHVTTRLGACDQQGCLEGPDSRAGGHLSWDAPNEPADPETEVLASIVVLVAGLAAEERAKILAGGTPFTLPLHLFPFPASNDQGQAERQMERLGMRPRAATFLPMTRTLVRHFWPAVEAVAQALLVKDLLPGDEARAIVDAALVGHP